MRGLAFAAGALVGWRVVARWARRFDVGGKVAVVTGGSRGLGLLIARELCERGARVALLARDAAELERARSLLAAEGHLVLLVPCDVTARSEVQDALALVREQLGQVQVLVNNAGVITVGPYEEHGLDDFHRAAATHLYGPLHTMLEAIPDMKAAGGGRIANVSSVGGKIGIPHLSAYSASKFALAGLSASLRAELEQHGVFVTLVVPGLMRTGSPMNALFKGRHRAEAAWFTVIDSLPFTSISARRAACAIVRGLERGDAELRLSWVTKLAAPLAGVAPELTADLLGVMGRLLPKPGGIGRRHALGRESRSAWTRSFLTALGDRAARAHNEIGAQR